MSFNSNGITIYNFSGSTIPPRGEVELRAKSTVADNTQEESVLIEVSKDKNQMILLVDYEQGDADSYLEIYEVFSDSAGTLFNNVVESFSPTTGIEVGVEPRRYRTTGRYRVAIPLCDYKVGVLSQIVGNVTGTVYGIKAVIGSA